jgi:Holliday junction resolvase-like predicted endonuclease
MRADDSGRREALLTDLVALTMTWISDARMERAVVNGVLSHSEIQRRRMENHARSELLLGRLCLLMPADVWRVFRRFEMPRLRDDSGHARADDVSANARRILELCYRRSAADQRAANDLLTRKPRKPRDATHVAETNVASRASIPPSLSLPLPPGGLMGSNYLISAGPTADRTIVTLSSSDLKALNQLAVLRFEAMKERPAAYGTATLDGNRIGARGEAAVGAVLEAAGAKRVQQVADEGDRRIDLIANDVTVEVKSSQPTWLEFHSPTLSAIQLCRIPSEAIFFCAAESPDTSPDVAVLGWTRTGYARHASELRINSRGILQSTFSAGLMPVESFVEWSHAYSMHHGFDREQARVYECGRCGWVSPLNACANCLARELAIPDALAITFGEYHRPTCPRGATALSTQPSGHALETARPCERCLRPQVVEEARKAGIAV